MRYILVPFLLKAAAADLSVVFYFATEAKNTLNEKHVFFCCDIVKLLALALTNLVLDDDDDIPTSNMSQMTTGL